MASYCIKNYEKPPAYFRDVHLQRLHVGDDEVDVVALQRAVVRMAAQLKDVVEHEQTLRESKVCTVRDRHAEVQFSQPFDAVPALSIVPLGKRPVSFAVDQLTSVGFKVIFDDDIEQFSYLAIEK